VEAQMIMAQIHAGFTPRDFLPDVDVVDPKRAVFYLELAANRKSRSATLHLADMKVSRTKKLTRFFFLSLLFCFFLTSPL
jgi:hypothetical protein